MSRHDRITEAIRQEASLVIHGQLKDPRLGFVTVTRVELTSDYRSAKIFYSVLGKEEDHKKTKEALDSALGFVRRMIAQRINLRFAPDIIFREDRSTEYSVKIEEVLNQIKEQNEPQPKKSRRLPKKV
ncbi:MAG: 30S ribosome-binding factor RbfA [Candidatus Omnitrophica bacterium]|nr:30S ribosome-binding factor RbfA [Candidatus Omnitrophota bacterium]